MAITPHVPLLLGPEPRGRQIAAKTGVRSPLANTGELEYSSGVVRFRCRQVLTGFVLGVTLVLLACPDVLAGPPTERLRDFFAEVNGVLADPAVQERPLEGVPRIRQLVTELSDVSVAAAAALGPPWQARTLAEREEFTDLFAELLERAYVGRLAGTARLSDGVQVLYLHEILAGDAATVATALGARQGRDVAIEYRMARRYGRWLVGDVVLDGVSILQNYHAQFKRLLQQGSYPELVSRLRAKLGEESLLFARAEPRVPAVMPAAGAMLEVRIAAPRREKVELASMPVAPRPVPHLTSDAAEIARPAAIPPSRVDADFTALPFWALFLGLVGAAGAAYFAKRTGVGSVLTGWRPPSS